MMKLFLSVMTLSLFVAGAINAQEDDSAMKPCENEVEKASADTSEVANEKVAKTICCFHSVPSFPGNIQQFFRDNLVWPVGRKNRKVEGRVIVKFYIERDGTCSQFKVLRSLNPTFDAEALRVLKLMPRWKMGNMVEGGTWYVLPVTFKRGKSKH